MNRVVLLGRLTKDIDLRMTTTGKAVVNFTLAVSGRKKDDDCNFIYCVAWNQVAELLKKYVSKGDRILIIGTLTAHNKEKDGQREYVHQVLVDEVEFIEPKKKDFTPVEAPTELPF